MRRRQPKKVLLACIALALGELAGMETFAQQPQATSAEVDAEVDVSVERVERLFVTTVKPLLVAKCGGCHGDQGKEILGEYDIRSLAGLLAGGESGEPSIVLGKSQESGLMAAVRWEDLEMPPKQNDRLTDEQIENLRVWIDGGAPWPDPAREQELIDSGGGDSAGHSTAASRGVMVKTSGGLGEAWTRRLYEPENLWAYQSVQMPSAEILQSMSDTGNGKNTSAIDLFVDRKLAEAEIEPAADVNLRTLIRRATYDLTGLPPTVEEVDAFLAASAQSPDSAFADLVERLLESPRYGEHWGKHWLDVVRYADTNGFSMDLVRANAWRYRDYVIRAFNSDKPFDQFVREQIAGDEIDPANVENLVAVGFLRMGPWEHTSMSVAPVTRQLYLDDITNSVGETFLGQALRCASCHDHKFDPISTRDYYRIQAVFAPVQFADRDAPYLESENTEGFTEGKHRIEKLLALEGVRSLQTISKEEWPVESFDEDTEKRGHKKVNAKRSLLLQHELNRYSSLALSVYNGPSREYRSNRPEHSMPTKKQLQGAIDDTHILMGGALESLGEKVSPGVLSATMPEVSDIDSKEPFPSGTNARRTALADWIASPDNPLTARVMVNRIWQYHFGKALARNPNNFGQTGKKPTHPELLDFLAVYFVAHDWSVKDMHRLMMLSNVYRRSGRHQDRMTVDQRDPNNELLSFFPPRRLAAEELRDSMLQVSGELNLKMGGIPARPEINREVAMQPRQIMGSVAPAYQPMPTPAERHRRTIYAQRVRTMRDPMLEVFNQPGLDASCERRDTSATTPQVFSLFNSQSSADRAVAMAQRVTQAASGLEAQIGLTFRFAFGRDANPAELTRCAEHIAKLTKHHQSHALEKVEQPTYVIREMVEEQTGMMFYWVEDLDEAQNFVADLKSWDVDAKTRAIADLCLVLFNSNEFIFVY